MSSRLGRQLWDKYEELRTNSMVGFLTDEDFQKYFLGFITYKYLSENLELYLDKELEKDDLKFEEAYNFENYGKVLAKKAIYNLGYFITPNHLFRNVIASYNQGADISRELKWAFAEINSSCKKTESQEDFENLFESVNLQATPLGKKQEDRNRVIYNILNALDSVDFGLDEFNSSLSLINHYSEPAREPGVNLDALEKELLSDPNKNIFLDDSPLNESSSIPLNEAPFEEYASMELFLDDIAPVEEFDSMELSNKENIVTGLENPNHPNSLVNEGWNDRSYDSYRIQKQYSIGDAFEYLLDKFSLNASKSADFYTPNDVSVLVSKLVATNKRAIDSVYDPCCGSSSMLLELNKHVSLNLICGQEVNTYYYNISRQNMILHNIHFKDFDIKQGDSLDSPHHIGYDKFDVVVSQIPFNVSWTAKKSFLNDQRFKEYNALAPRVKAEYAFIQHMLYHLDDDGIMVVIAPHGVLFRSASEESIRKIIVSKMNYLDAVIGLPSNMFYSTNSPACVLIFKKNRRYDDDVLFIDASKNFNKIKLRNNLRKEDINKIVGTYVSRAEVDKYSRRVSLREIDENNCNLNIPRYVDTYEEEEINIQEIYKRREEASRELKEVTYEIDELCKELGIENPLINNIFE